jgi:hypothetical protein
MFRVDPAAVLLFVRWLMRSLPQFCQQLPLVPPQLAHIILLDGTASGRNTTTTNNLLLLAAVK